MCSAPCSVTRRQPRLYVCQVRFANCSFVNHVNDNTSVFQLKAGSWNFFFFFFLPSCSTVPAPPRPHPPKHSKTITSVALTGSICVGPVGPVRVAVTGGHSVHFHRPPGTRATLWQFTTCSTKLRGLGETLQRGASG